MTSNLYQREIAAPIETVFDLCRSIDFHIEAAKAIKARAVGGQTSGLAEEGSITVYSAAFYGCRFKLAMEASHLRAPFEFQDKMVRGLFAHFSHHYILKSTTKGCLLEDTFSFALPLSPLGTLVERFFLFPSLDAAQNTRLDAIKRKAESFNS